jgi:hypothetical protein
VPASALASRPYEQSCADISIPVQVGLLPDKSFPPQVIPVSLSAPADATILGMKLAKQQGIKCITLSKVLAVLAIYLITPL